MNKKCPPAPIMDDVFYCSLSKEQGLREEWVEVGWKWKPVYNLERTWGKLGRQPVVWDEASATDVGTPFLSGSIFLCVFQGGLQGILWQKSAVVR